jgi:UDP-N-acetylmuramoylalanine--D-glutamate ligase
MAKAQSLVGELTSWHSRWSEAKIAVVGLGKTGFSAADTLNELGAQLLVVSEAASLETLDILDVLGIEYRISDDQTQLLKALGDFAPDLVVISPGIAPENGLVKYLADAGIQLWTDVDLAWRLRDKFGIDQQWICITGTNGKTTTTEITEAMLLASGIRAAACGNIGKPILDCVRDPAEFEVLVVELSSFQLHYLDSISPFSSVVLNVAEDHLDWHGGMEKYRLSKGRIYENTRVACVYNLEDATTEALVEAANVQPGARAIGFGLGTPMRSNVGYVEDLLVDRAFLEERESAALEIASLSDLESFGVLTPHLLSNIAAATALARSFGVPPAACRKALREFRISPHRIELVAEIDGVRFVNDSKATNAHAAEASLSSFESVVWILGGLLKGVDPSGVIHKFRDRLRAAVLIGSDKSIITAAFESVAPNLPLREIADSGSVMRDAVSAAAGLAQSGDVVLLAPLGASMDQFENYQDRGDQFRAAVLDLAGGGK